MIYEAHFKIIRQFVSIASELALTQIIEAFDNRSSKDIPPGDYCAIHLKAAKSHGKPLQDIAATLQDITTTFRQQKKMTVSLYFYRGNAFENASKIEGSDMLEQVYLLLSQNGLGIKKIGEAVRRPKLQSSEYEERADIDVIFYFEDVRQETVQLGQSVDIIVKNEHGKTISGEN